MQRGGDSVGGVLGLELGGDSVGGVLELQLGGDSVGGVLGLQLGGVGGPVRVGRGGSHAERLLLEECQHFLCLQVAAEASPHSIGCCDGCGESLVEGKGSDGWTQLLNAGWERHLLSRLWSLWSEDLT